MKNQCDGCNRGLPVDENGIHRGNGGPDMQCCTAERYKQPAPKDPDDTVEHPERWDGQS